MGRGALTAARPARFAGLDRLRGIALWAMLLHHAVMWMVGDARTRLGGDTGMAATDLAAPMFAVAAGAGAVLLARRLRTQRWTATASALGRWVVIAAWGVGVGAVIDHRVDSVGVLETLAACGAVVMLVAVAAAPRALTWAALSAALTVASLPVIHAGAAAGGWWAQAFGDSFPLVSYLAMATAGAAVAAALDDEERQPVLDAVAVGAALALAGLVAAGAGVWPADRHPGGPAFIVPGVVVALAVWAVAGRMVPGPVVRGLERAGRRTLLVYVGHYALRVVLDLGGWWAALRGPWWTAAAVGVAVVMAALSALPRPGGSSRVTGAASGQERHRDLELTGA